MSGAEFLINDCLPFLRFLGLELSDRVADARTIWLFREKRTKAGARAIVRALRNPVTIAMSGQIVEASLSAAHADATPKARKKRSRTAPGPDDRKDKPAKLRQLA
jgi:transposase, IS5 family